MMIEALDNLHGIWWLIAIVALFAALGIPYTVRVWKEVLSPREEIENARIQMEILQCYTSFIDPSDVDSMTQVRERARKLVIDAVIEPKPTSTQEIALGLLQFVVGMVCLGMGTLVGVLPVAWFAKDERVAPALLSGAGVIYLAYRIIRAAEKRGGELGPVFGGPFVGGLFLGPIGFCLVVIIWVIID